MRRNRRRRRRRWPVVLVVILIVAALLLAGGLFLKKKLVRVAAEKMIEQQAQEYEGGQTADIMDRMSEEDLDVATKIADKYITAGKVSEYMKLYTGGDLDAIKQDLKATMSQEDLDTLRALYQTYQSQ